MVRTQSEAKRFFVDMARSFTTDVATRPEAESQWRQAAAVLHEGDHYILVMLGEAVGDRLKRWWQFWR